MTGGRRRRVGRLGLWGAVWAVRRVLLLSDQILGPYGRSRAGAYYHVCEEEHCTAAAFRSRASTEQTCRHGHTTVAAAARQGTPSPAHATRGRYVYVCLDCLGPPVRQGAEGAPPCDRHRPPRAMTLLAKP